MQPIEFVMEMSGISKVLGPDEVPTLAQWQRIHAMLADTMGPLVARKLFELGEEYEKQQKQKFDLYQEISKKYATSPVTTTTTTTGIFGTPGVHDIFIGTGTGPQIAQPGWQRNNIK